MISSHSQEPRPEAPATINEPDETLICSEKPVADAKEYIEKAIQCIETAQNSGLVQDEFELSGDWLDTVCAKLKNLL